MQFHTVFVALILSQITYVLSAWGRQLNRQLQKRLDVFLKPARKFGFCDENYITTDLLDKADARFFRFVQRPKHCFHHLSPDTINSSSIKLSYRGHSFPFRNANIACIKTHTFHGVCSNMCSC